MIIQVGFRNRINVANAILKNQKRDIGEQALYYNLNKYKQKGSFDIINDISEHVNLVQLMDSLGNVNHDISVVGYWIFDSNYEKPLVINRNSLDIIFYPSVVE